jgi:Tfp pilus assembly PilM family ATPase
MKFAIPKFPPIRLAVVMLGDRLGVAAIQRDRVETFSVEAENPGAALRAELDARSLPARTVAIGLARSTVTVKPIDLPAVAGAAQDMVKFELERHLPIPADDAAFDFAELPPEPDVESPSEGKRVLIAAADRRLIEAALRVADEAKLRPVSITVAAHNLVALVDTDRQQRVAWLHRNGDTAELLLLHGDMVVFSRSFAAVDDETLNTETRRSFAGARWRGCNAIWVSGDGAAAAPLLDLGRHAPSDVWRRSPSRAAPWSSRWRRRPTAVFARST